jgi:hypothetical protein
MHDDFTLQAQTACGGVLYQAADYTGDGGVRHAEPKHIGLKLGAAEGNERTPRAPLRTAGDDLMEGNAREN